MYRATYDKPQTTFSLTCRYIKQLKAMGIFDFFKGKEVNRDIEAKENESLLKSVLKQNDSFRIDVRSSAFSNHLKKKNK